MTSNGNGNSNPLIRLAHALLNQGYDEAGTYDVIVMYEALEPILTKPQYIRLGAMLELCPIHHCDIQICLDDEVHGNEVYEEGGE